MGADEASVLDAERRRRAWTESWRIAKGVRTLRRIWMSLPFLVGSVPRHPRAAVGLLRRGVRPVEADARGARLASTSSSASPGCSSAARSGNRLLASRPGRVVTYAGARRGRAGGGVRWSSPSSPWLRARGRRRLRRHRSSLPILGADARRADDAWSSRPGSAASPSAAGALFIAPGVARRAARRLARPTRTASAAGSLMLVPVFLIGAAILGSAGPSVEADIRAATAAAMAGREEPPVEAARAREAARLPRRRRALRPGAGPLRRRLRRRARARSSPCSAPTAPASRRCSAPSPASTAAVERRHLLRRRGHHLPARQRARRARHRAGAGRQGRVPDPHRRREPAGSPAGCSATTPSTCRDATEQVLEFFPRPPRAHATRPAGNLSGGEQQMLTLGQAFLAEAEAADDRRAVARPRPGGRRAAARDRPGHPRARARRSSSSSSR